MVNGAEQKTLLQQQQQNNRHNGGQPQIVRTNGSDAGEKSPFLAKPVQLTPAWEANNLPNDELNFKGMTMERAKMEVNPPTDRYNLIFITLLIHGIGTLMPWNMFITANSYFEYKLGADYTGFESPYKAYFLASLGFAAQVPNVVFNWLNIFLNLGGNLTPRIVYSILVEVIVFIGTVILAMLDSSAWPAEFFWLTMASVVVLNIAGGVYQNSVYGMAAKLPGKYTGAVVLGSNVSGTFTAVISILSSLLSSSVRTAGIYYFITAMFVLLMCFDTYFALPLNKFFRYHEMLNEREAERQRLVDNGPPGRPPYLTIFKQTFPQLFNIFFVFFVTLSVFPAVQVNIKSVEASGFFISDPKLYADVLCFLTFNLCAMLGSATASAVQWPRKEHLVWPVVLRVLFIPLLLMCNYAPAGLVRSLPVYIVNDYLYWIIGILMGYSSGYLSSLGMQYAPQMVSKQHEATAGMFGAAMLITGIFSGIMFSVVMPGMVSMEW